MIGHTMKYVAMCERVAKEHPEREAEFVYAARVLHECEVATVQAYVHFKNLLRELEAEGSELAAKLVAETYWDLT